ncbi:hypothetical protein GCM10012284_64420 [Mangrovihabitans endophyticus]|uniref:Uncharacterized protein n=1 Tax=Mangrovihabitans endophyticus TaxID=1751298 RepID=A0A8J3C8W2_9ACTN|nr:hypothetical protein GCM10012284_64420 [Mangrovihabitans endophyticus]
MAARWSTVRNVTFVAFRPGSPRAEKKLRDRPAAMQIGVPRVAHVSGEGPRGRSVKQ